MEADIHASGEVAVQPAYAFCHCMFGCLSLHDCMRQSVRMWSMCLGYDVFETQSARSQLEHVCLRCHDRCCNCGVAIAAFCPTPVPTGVKHNWELVIGAEAGPDRSAYEENWS